MCFCDKRCQRHTWLEILRVWEEIRRPPLIKHVDTFYRGWSSHTSGYYSFHPYPIKCVDRVSINPSDRRTISKLQARLALCIEHFSCRCCLAFRTAFSCAVFGERGMRACAAPDQRVVLDGCLVQASPPSEFRRVYLKYTVRISKGVDACAHTNRQKRSHSSRKHDPQWNKGAAAQANTRDEKKLTAHKDSEPFDGSFHYRRVIGQLNYLEKGSRPDISYAAHQCARFSANPKKEHGDAIRSSVPRSLCNPRILRKFYSNFP